MNSLKKKNSFGLIFVALFVLSLFFSCEVGLGSAVDVQAPEINIEKPEVDLVICNKFVISGTWSDDGEIENVYVKLKRTDGRALDGKSKKELLIPGAFELSPVDKGEGTWKAEVDPLDEDSPILDGTYQATIVIKDKGNHTTTQSTTFTVDNTAPVLILSKPNSTPGDKTMSAYGQRLFLEGSVADSTKDTWIEINFYSNEDCSEDSYLTTLETGLIAPTDVNSNNARLAVFNSDLTKELAEEYKAIYGKITKDGSRTVYSKITVYDTAETCTDDDTPQATGKNGKKKGNASQSFYISKLLAESITKSQDANGYGLAPIDIYNVLNGTYALKNESRSAMVDSVKAELETAALKKDKAVFTINPENSPYFTVSGLKTLVGNGEDFKEGNGYTIVNGTQTLEISVFMGSDSIALKDDENFYVYLLECDNYGVPLDADDKESSRIKLYSKYDETGSGANKKTYYSIGGKTDHKTTSGAYVFSVPMSKTVKVNPDLGDQGYANIALEYGHNYLIRLSGTDTEGNNIETTDTGYGFRFTAGGSAPIANITEPKETTVWVKKGDDIPVKGTIKSEEGEPFFMVMNGDEKLIDVPLTPTEENGVYSFDTIIPAEKFSQTESLVYSLDFIVTRDETKASYPKSVWYDVEGPEVSMNTPVPLVKASASTGVTKDSINGKITLTGSIVDMFDQFKEAGFRVEQNGVAVTGEGLSGELESNFEFEIDTTKLTDEKDASIIITATDRAGNVSEKAYTYYVSQKTDLPHIISTEAGKDITKGIGDVGLSYVESGNNLFVRGGNLVLSVSDDDGVNKAHVLIQAYDKTKPEGQRLEDVAAVNDKQNIDYLSPSVISHTLPNSVGVYQVTVTVYDKNYVSDSATPNNFETIQFFLRVTGTGPDVSITPDREYIKSGASYILTFNVTNEGNTPYMLKVGDSEQAAPGYEEINDDSFTYTLTPADGAESIKFTIIDKNASFTEKNFKPKFDNQKPEITIGSTPNTTATEESTYLFKGTLKDEHTATSGASGVTGVQIKFSDSTKDTGWIDVESFSSTSWNYEAVWASDALKNVFATETQKTVSVKAIDEAGNESIVTADNTKIFVYDKHNPSITVTAPSSTNAKADVTVNVAISDTNPDKINVTLKNEAGEVKYSQEISITGFTGSSGTRDITIDKSKFADSGDYTVTVSVVDKNGRTSNTETKTIKCDKLEPVITIAAPNGDIEWANAVSANSYTFKVNFDDGTGTGVDKIYYAYSDNGTAPADGHDAWEEEVFADGDKFILRDPLPEGTIYLHVKAIDKAGNATEVKTRKISVDKASPTLSVTNSLSTEGTNYLSGEVTSSGYKLSGSVSDTNKLDTTTAIEIKVDGVSKFTKAATEKALNWEYTIPKGTDNGTLKSDKSVKVEIIATDIAGNTDSKKYNIYYDTKAPVLTISAPVTGEAVSQNVKAISGTVSDNGYGVEKIEYTLKRGSTEITSSSVNPVEITGEQWAIKETTTNGGKIPLGDTEGGLTLIVKAYENKNGSNGGRTTEQTVEFYYDKDNPSLTETGVNTTGKTTNTKFTFSGTASDSNALDRIEISLGTGANAKKWSSKDTNSVITINDDSSWTATFVVNTTPANDTDRKSSTDAEGNTTTNAIADGAQEFTITAYDIAKKEKQLTRTVTVDTQAPVVGTPTINSTSGETIGTVLWYTTTSIPVEVPVTEFGLSGISKVEYKVGSGSWTPLSYINSKYQGTINFATDGAQTFVLKATDVAGNVSAEKTADVNIDTSAPNLSALYYKKGSGSAETIANTIYIQENTKITVYGNYDDAQSGVKALTFTYGSPAVKYSTTAIGGSAPSDDSYTLTAVTGKETTIKSWRAEFTPSADGTLKVSGKNRVETTTSELKVFDVTVDSEKPSIDNVKLIEVKTGVADKQAYNNGTSYFVNNSTAAGKKFKISGGASDNVGVASVELKVTKKGTTTTTPGTFGGNLNQWNFSGIDLSAWDGDGATAVVTVTDKAGNTESVTLDIIFDAVAPSSDHKIDDALKNLEFRIGDAKNDANEDDVGSKYSDGTYGSSLTMQIRGYFPDNAGGSGINKFYYKTFNNLEVTIDENKENGLEENGKKYFKSLDDLKNHVIANKTDIFSPLEEPETKNVEYNIGPYTPNSWVEVPAARRRFGGTATTDADSDGKYKANKKGYVQFRTAVDTNFKTTIKGFVVGKNYLVLVAEDNAGNTSVDSAVVSGVIYPCYSLNVDTVAPEILEVNDGDFSNNYIVNAAGKISTGETLTLTGKVKDDRAGIKSFIIKVNETEIDESYIKYDIVYDEDGTTIKSYKADIPKDSAEHTWTAIIPNTVINAQTGAIAVYAEATDDAGSGHAVSQKIASIQLDNTAPSLRVTSTSGWIKNSLSGASVYVNDTNGIKDNSISYNVYESTDTNYATSKASGTALLNDEGVATITSINTSNSTTFQDGKSYIIRFSAKDTVDNEGFVNTAAYTVDRTGPSISDSESGIGTIKTETNVEAAAQYFKEKTLSVVGKYTDKAASITGSGVAKIHYKLNSNAAAYWSTTNGTYNSTLAGFTDGTNTLELWAEDAMGNTGTHTTYTVKVDTVAPALTEDLTQVNTNGKAANIPTFTFNVTEAQSGIQASDFTVQLDETPLTITTTSTAGTAANILTLGTKTGDVYPVTLQIGTAALAEKSGSFAVKVKVKDKVENESSLTTVKTIGIDTNNPEPTFTSPAVDSIVNGTITVKGAVTDPSNSAISAIKLTAKCDSTTKEYVYPAETGKGTITYLNGQWEAVINTTELNATATAKDLTLTLTATDAYANTNTTAATLSLSIDQNSDRPVVKFTNLTNIGTTEAPSYILKFGTDSQLEGNVSDDDSVSSAVVDIFVVSSAQLTAAPVNNTDGWTRTVSTDEKEITWKHETYGETTYNKTSGDYTYTPAVKTDGSKNVYFYVKDNNGKEFYTGHTDVLNKPYQQYKTDAKTDNSAVITYKSDGNSPRISDVKIQAYTGTTENGGQLQPGTDTVVGGSKKNKIKFIIKASDANGIKDMNLVYTPAGGSDVTLTSASGTFQATTTDAEAVWTTDYIDVSSIVFGESKKYGSVNVAITANDQSGLMANSNQVFMVDNDGPGVAISSPNATDELTGTQVFAGNTTDSGNAGVEKTEWLIPSTTNAGKTDAQLAALTGWQHNLVAKSSDSSWKFEFTAEELAAYDSNTYASSINNGVYTLPFYIKSTDALGNYTIQRTTFKHNPDADRPKTEITYPNNRNYSDDGDWVTLGGAIRISGSAVIPSNTTTVDSVYVQIVNGTNNLGENEAIGDKYTLTSAWAASHGCTVLTKAAVETAIGKTLTFADDFAWGIKADRTGAWSLTINDRGDMNPSGQGDDKITFIAIRACAINADGRVGSWTDWYYINIDDTAPTQSATLYQFKNTAPSADCDASTVLAPANIEKSLPYESDMYLKGDWYMVVKLHDESELKTYSVKLGSSTALTDGTLTNGYGYYHSPKVTGSDGKEKTQYLFIPVKALAGSSSANYTIMVDDGEHTISDVYSLNIDNTAPEITKVYKGSTDVEANYLKEDSSNTITNSNYVYTLGGKVGEDGSGFERLVFYYVRSKAIDNVTYTRQAVLDPLVTTGTSNSKAYLFAEDTGDNAGKDNTDSPLLNTGTYTQGDKSYTLYGKNIAGKLSTDGFKFTPTTPADITGNVHIRLGGLIEVGGLLRKIESISAAGVVSFDKGTGATATETSVTAFFPYAQVVDNTTTEKVASQSANPFTFTDNADDGDKMPETLTGSKSLGFTWDATVHSDNMPDGPCALVVLAFDKAGNVSGKTYPVKIENSAPRLAKVFLGTDLNSSGTWTGDEFVGYDLYNANETHHIGNTEVKAQQTIATADYGQAFTVKDKLAVVAEIIGGNGDITMVYGKAVENNNPVTKAAGITATSNTTIPNLIGADDKIGTVTYNQSSVATSLKAFTLTSKQVLGKGADYTIDDSTDGDGNTASFTFWDSTDELTAGTNSQNCVFYVTDLVFDLYDGIGPKVVVNPFYWSSKTINSLYDNNPENGHIELSADWENSDYYKGLETKPTTGEYDLDPKVSGIITFTGTAYDDHALNTLKFTLKNSAAEPTTYLNNITMATYAPATDWNKTSGNSGATLANGGSYEWTISTSATDTTRHYSDTAYLNQDGHKIYWTISIDTAQISDVAASDVVLSVTATDLSSNDSATGVTAPVTTNNTYVVTDGTTSVPSYKMDVVPYIKSISTPNRTVSGLKDNNIRSASGKYSILANRSITSNNVTTSNDIVVTGFNLSTSSLVVRLVSDSVLTATGDNVLTYNKAEGTGIKNLSLSATGRSTSSVTIKNGSGNNGSSVSSSGYLEIFSNQVRSLNNLNADNARGSVTGTAISDYENYYNREPDYYQTKNVQLTDDRYLLFFDMKDTGKKNAYYPNMIMDGNDPVFGFVDLNGTTDTDYGIEQLRNRYQPQRAKFSGTSGAQSSIEYLIGGGSSWSDMAMVKDSANKYIHAVVDNATGSGLSVIYNTYAGDYQWRYYNNTRYPAIKGAWGWGSTAFNVMYDDYGNDAIQFASITGNNAIALETINHDAGLLMGRYQNIKMIAKGDSTSTNGASFYMAYFDDNTSSKDVIFRTFQIKQKTSNGWNQLKDKANGNAIKTNLTEDDTSGRIVARPSGTTYKGSKYLDIGVTSDNHVVIVYYDMEEGQLRLMYSGNAVDGSSITPNITWTAANVTFPSYVGTDVSMVIDGSNGIHITASDSTDSDLVYMYMPSYSSSVLKTVRVDQAFAVGTWTSIKVKGNATDGYVPYIAYYNATETGSRDTIKLAYYSNTATKISTTTQNQDIIQGVDSNGYTTGNWEYMTVPAITPPQGGDSKFRAVCLDFDNSGNPVVGYLGTNLEFGKWFTE